MKRIIFLIPILLFASNLLAQGYYAQDGEQENDDDPIRTIFSGDIEHGGYGAFSINYTEIDNKNAIAMSGRGGWIVNHAFAVGMAGVGFFNEPTYSSVLSDGYKYSITGGYGGFLIEPIIGGKHPVHFSVPVFVGGGGVSYMRQNYNYNSYYYEDNMVDMDAFFVVEPGIEIEFNVLSFFRFAIGGYYRYTSAIELRANTPEQKALAPDDALRGFSAGISFKFGRF